jgi:hypothetical protein
MIVKMQGAALPVYENIVWCHRENNVPSLKNVSFFKGVPEFGNPENTE